jgi:hypothetical protein
MVRPNFDSPLVLVDQYDPDTGDTKPAPLAKGPIAPGDLFKWVAVWIFQNPGDGPGAAAAGHSGYNNTMQGNWQVDTFLVKGSDEFSTGEPALAMALALIWRGGDEQEREFYWWTEPVALEQSPPPPAPPS